MAEYRIQNLMQISPAQMMARDKSGIPTLVRYDMIDAILVSQDNRLSVHVGRRAFQAEIGPEDEEAINALLAHVAKASEK